MATPTRTGSESAGGSTEAAWAAVGSLGLGCFQRRIRVDERADLGSRRGGETVVEQVCRLLPGRDRNSGCLCIRMATRRRPSRLARTDEGLARVIGASGLAAHRARVVGEQLVVVLDRAGRIAVAPGEVVGLRAAHDVGEGRVLPGVSVEQARCRRPRCSCRGRPGPTGWRLGCRARRACLRQDVQLLQSWGPCRPAEPPAHVRRRCPECMSRPCSRSLIVYRPPARRPRWVPSWRRHRPAVPATTLLRLEAH